MTFLLSFLAFLFFSFFHSWEVPFIALEAIYFYVDGTAASPSSAHGLEMAVFFEEPGTCSYFCTTILRMPTCIFLEVQDSTKFQILLLK